MSKSELRRFIYEVNRSDKLKLLLAMLGLSRFFELPQYEFDFPMKLREGFESLVWSLLRPDREDVDRICPGLKPNGYPTLAHILSQPVTVNCNKRKGIFVPVNAILVEIMFGF